MFRLEYYLQADGARNLNGWGRARGAYDTRWLHSDLKDMAYFYIYKLFDAFRQVGEVNQ